MGIFFSPVDPYFVALIIAFGAGCLMFAVRSEKGAGGGGSFAR